MTVTQQHITEHITAGCRFNCGGETRARQAQLDRENLIEARAELSTLDAYARALGYATAVDALVTA